MKKLFLAALATLLVIGSAFADSHKSRPAVIIPDADMIPNLNIKTDDELFGLYCTPAGYILLPTLVDVEHCFDAYARPIMRVHAKSDSKPLFLMAGVRGLKPGLKNYVFAGDKFLFPGETLLLGGSNAPCAGDPLRLQAFGKVVKRSGFNLIYDYSIRLAKRQNSQVLDYYKADDQKSFRQGKPAVLNITDHLVKTDLTGEMKLPVLIWAGDLDNDSQPDLFMWWPCPGKDAGIYSVFLSSKAGPGELAGKVVGGLRLAGH